MATSSVRAFALFFFLTVAAAAVEAIPDESRPAANSRARLARASPAGVEALLSDDVSPFAKTAENAPEAEGSVKSEETAEGGSAITRVSRQSSWRRGAAPAHPDALRSRRTPAYDWVYRLLTGRGEGHGTEGLEDNALPLALVLPLRTDYESDEELEEPRGRWARPPRPTRPPPAHRQRSGVQAPGEEYVNSASTAELVAMFRAQQPRAPELPPVVLPGSEPAPAEETPLPACAAPAPAPFALASTEPPAAKPRTTRSTRRSRQSRPAPASAPLAGAGASSPAAPRFSRSLALRGRLTVPRADYTETYNATWHAPSGSMQVDFYDGSTSSHRFVNGTKVERVLMQLDRSGAAPTRRCAVMTAQAAPADAAPPALPDLTPYQFSGYVEYEGVRAERWQNTVTGGSGELGGARGEALTFRHEMLLTRDANDDVIPLKYTVAVDSSLLGPDSDGYTHRYSAVRAAEAAPAQLRADLAACDALATSADVAALEPLREFVQPTRDPKYDDAFTSYTKNYNRNYKDNSEMAMRKNLLMQTLRLSAAGNRQGPSFGLGTTPLADRLQAELQQQAGVASAAERLPSEEFPYSRAQLRALADALPDEFDWRTRGGVTHVRNQGSCSSCWAFAVTGAVEGALFRRTRRLVALSEQAIVDCAQPFGGGGCNPTWPTFAYDYAKERGLPALDEYTEYHAKVLECRDRQVPPVTHISGHVNVTKHDVSALKVAIKRHGPTVVIIDVSPPSYKTYTHGVYADARCNKRPVNNHAVLAVGWGVEGEVGEYFTIKNSHGTSFGEGGFMRLRARTNTCGVLKRPSYPRLEPGDVTGLPPPAPAPPSDNAL